MVVPPLVQCGPPRPPASGVSVNVPPASVESSLPLDGSSVDHLEPQSVSSLKCPANDDAEEFGGIPVPGSDDDSEGSGPIVEIQLFVYYPQITNCSPVVPRQGSEVDSTDNSSSSVLPEICVVISVDPDRTIAHLKGLIAEAMGCADIPPSMRVHANGRTLRAGVSIADSDLVEGSTVHVMASLRGGTDITSPAPTPALKAMWDTLNQFSSDVGVARVAAPGVSTSIGHVPALSLFSDTNMMGTSLPNMSPPSSPWHRPPLPRVSLFTPLGE